ncbi:vWA domain-containing protein [Allopusillimonas ginsengisoli]|uniref:vWA domain-containing protein n=1 Tax=Allopusillimonas ginsengisoli TaxID=453575 RepID=UPI00101EDB9E|nr:VWA domain-containing protein [Allopusillimonas ginsengisoli]TEA79327.1 VWA domain-containing protein [Allopusillimonas ginsengisoli]
MNRLPALLLAAGVAASTLPLSAAQAADDVLIVYDASGSMWGQVDGVNKIVTARKVMGELVKSWPEETNLGLIAYGHRSAGSCSDIETMIEPQRVDRVAFINTVNAITPKGKTPISASLKQAADVLQYRDHNATVVLISDGLESCHGDPCAVAAELKEKGVDFKAHVVGFDLDQEGNEALSCIAKNTGGIFVPASNADELQDALRQVQAKVTQKKAEPEPAPEPPAAEPEYTVQVNAPEQAITGTRFDVSWTKALNSRDWVQIVPVDTPEGELTSYIRVENALKGQLTAPGEPGLYEVRYVLSQGGKTLASAPVEVVEAEMGISAPGQLTAGARFEVSWTSALNSRDWVQIVPAGSPEGKLTNYIRVDSALKGQLTAPGKPGLYEVRYVLSQGGKTLATAPAEVTTAQQAITGPDVVRADAAVDVSWTTAINPRDMVVIAPAGSPDKTLDGRKRVDSRLKISLKAPRQPGLYEIRYVLDQDGSVQARHNLEVVAADSALSSGAVLTVPAQASPSQAVTMSWTGGSDSKDQRVALASKDQADFTWIDAKKINEAKALEFNMPEEPGDYEVRYLDVSQRAVLGRAIIKVR